MSSIRKIPLCAAALLLMLAGDSFAGEKKELSFEQIMSGQVDDKASAAEKASPKKEAPPSPKYAAPKAPAAAKAKTPLLSQPQPKSAGTEKVPQAIASEFKAEASATITENPVSAVQAEESKSMFPPQPTDTENAVPTVAAASEEKVATSITGKPAEPVSASVAAPAPPKWFDAINVNGLVDVYYSYNGNGYRGMGDNQYLGFAPDSTEFSAAIFELNIEKKPTVEHPTGLYIGLMAGTTPYLIDQAGDKNPYSGMLRQGYGSLLLAQGLQLDVGKYVTLMGAELIESNANWNYTRSLLFTYAIPFTHTGARLTYTVNDAFYIQGHIINGWNNGINHTSGKGAGVQVGLTPIKQLPIVLNYMTGSESKAANATGSLADIGSRSLFDAIITFNATDTLSFMVNYDVGSQSNGAASGGIANWTGVAGYAKYSGTMPLFSAIALRYENYSDADGYTTGTKQTLNEETITLEKTVDGALLRMEIRHDSSDHNVFSVSDGTTSQAQLTITLGMVFTF